MADTKIAISGQSKKMLESFKKVVDAVIEEEMPFPDYVAIVIDKGIKGIISIPFQTFYQVFWQLLSYIGF